jgi:hypothetical protein
VNDNNALPMALNRPIDAGAVAFLTMHRKLLREVYPRWEEVGMLLAAWKKNPASPLYASNMSLDVLRLIIEYAWDCTLPHELRIH